MVLEPKERSDGNRQPSLHPTTHAKKYHTQSQVQIHCLLHVSVMLRFFLCGHLTAEERTSDNHLLKEQAKLVGCFCCYHCHPRSFKAIQVASAKQALSGNRDRLRWNMAPETTGWLLSHSNSFEGWHWLLNIPWHMGLSIFLITVQITHLHLPCGGLLKLYKNCV